MHGERTAVFDARGAYIARRPAGPCERVFLSFSNASALNGSPAGCATCCAVLLDGSSTNAARITPKAVTIVLMNTTL